MKISKRSDREKIQSVINNIEKQITQQNEMLSSGCIELDFLIKNIYNDCMPEVIKDLKSALEKMNLIKSVFDKVNSEGHVMLDKFMEDKILK